MIVNQNNSQNANSQITYRAVKVPQSTEWEWTTATQLMQGIFAVSKPIVLEIRATDWEIQWGFKLATAHAATVEKALYSLYPTAEMHARGVAAPDSTARHFSFEAAGPFVQPLKYAEDFRQLDPLAMVVGAIGDLQPGEQVVYELVLTPSSEERFKEGEKLLTRSTIRWSDFLTPDGAIGAALDKAMGLDKLPRYVPDLQRLAQEKLSSLLKEAALRLKITAAGARRAAAIAARVKPALAPFARERSNYLVPAEEVSHSLVLSPYEAAALWHLPSEQCHHPHIVWAASAKAPILVRPHGAPSGVTLGMNTFQGRERTVTIDYRDRVTHSVIIGRTGTGKTNLMHHMVHQDIANGKGVGIIDPHGRLASDILSASIPAEREDDVVLFDMTDTEYPVGLNLLDAPANVPREAVASQALSVIRKIFADNWSATRMEDALYAALAALLTVLGTTIQDIHRLFHHSGFRANLLQRVTDPIALEFWYDEFEVSSDANQREIAKPISNRVRRFYRNKKIRRVVCQPRSLDFRQIMDEGKIFIANLSGLSDIEAETLGALLISKFQIAAMSRSYDRRTTRPYYLHVDEVQNFVTTSLPKVFAEARKPGLSLSVAHQFQRQLRGQTLEAVMGNVGTTIIFRVGARDANALGPFVKPQFDARALASLNRFSAVVTMQSGGETLPAFTLNPPPPLPLPADAPDRVARIRALSRQKYARHKDIVDEEHRQRYATYRRPDPPADDDGDEFDFFG